MSEARVAFTKENFIYERLKITPWITFVTNASEMQCKMQ